MSEVSEYVPPIARLRDRLIAGGAEPESPELAAKVAAYERRLPMMNEQRLRPEIPDWPAACFYPMNKSRVVGANWFSEPFSARNAMMAEHAQSGIAFAGKVSQLISVGVGLDDWEWMVTLWARNPEFLRELCTRCGLTKPVPSTPSSGRSMWAIVPVLKRFSNIASLDECFDLGSELFSREMISLDSRRNPFRG